TMLLLALSVAGCATTAAQAGTSHATAKTPSSAAESVDLDKLTEGWDGLVGKRVRVTGTYDTWGSMANVFGVKDNAMVDIKGQNGEVRCWLGDRTPALDAAFESYEPGKTTVVVTGTVDKEQYFLTSCKAEKAH